MTAAELDRRLQHFLHLTRAQQMAVDADRWVPTIELHRLLHRHRRGLIRYDDLPHAA